MVDVLRRAKRLSTLLFVGIVGVSTATCTGNYAGFCWAEMRIVSDQEKIRAAVEYTLRGTLHNQTLTIIEPTAEAIRYRPVRVLSKPASAEEFLAAYPDCCRMGPERGDDFTPLTFPRRISGEFSDTVVVEFDIAYVDKDGTRKTAHVKNQWVVTACGQTTGY